MEQPQNRSRERSTTLVDRLVDALHVEALVLADEVRGYFDDAGRVERDRLAPIDRVLFSCESLKVTTRLMHVMAWLLRRRAMAEGGAPLGPQRITRSPNSHIDSAPDVIATLPPTARRLIEASIDLHARICRLEAEIDRGETTTSPARVLLGRLERAL